KAYAGKEESIVDIIQQLENDPDLGVRRAETSIDLESLMELQDAAPVRKLINMVFLLAIKDHSSDIHFEPFEDEYKMRYRCDGILYEMVPPPRHLAMAIASRIKVMSNLDIAERRLPQDGRIELNVGGNQVDMRVSVLPTMSGDGIVQCQIHHDIGLTFASALRSILRQDPDIILVGEIRDLETAQIAVQASLTGHMVFSTLHTNDAPSSITRMRDMGLEPYLITATLEGILAQRLVRRICEDCRTEFQPSPEML